jgi:hypothetical protein
VGGTHRAAPAAPAAVALTVVAALALLVAGGWAVLAGVSALLGDALFSTAPGPLPGLGLTGLGWALVVLGVLLAGCGFAVLAGGAWAQRAGVVVAVLAMVAAFLLVPHHPGWAVAMIGLDVVVIRVLLGHRSAAR